MPGASEHITGASISFRVGLHQWLDERRFDELLQLFEKHQGVTDQITLITAYAHVPIKLDLMNQRCEVLAERMAHVRRLGYQTGINLLSTIGHVDEYGSSSLDEDYVRLTDIDGNSHQAYFCPNDMRFRDEYVGKVYQGLASADPDYIWLDDDIRVHWHKPILFACFCDNCMGIFSKETGKEYTRAALKEAFNTGSAERKLEIREAWLEHNCDLMSSLLAFIEGVVHGSKPGLPLGLMTGAMLYELCGFRQWAEVLSGPGKSEVMWRPGGGFYADENLRELMRKAHAIGPQVAELPENVVTIQSEVENFSYERLKKAARSTVLEAAVHIAAGCTGNAFNVLSLNDEPLAEYGELVCEIRRARPFLDLLVQRSGRSMPTGLFAGWNRATFTTHNIHGGDWFDGRVEEMPDRHAEEIFELGVSPAYCLEKASVTALAGENVLALSDEEIERILASGVYVDAKALDNLNKRGFDGLTGFTLSGSAEHCSMEKFVEHPLNGGFSGRKRDGRQSFEQPGQANVLEPSDRGAQILSEMIDYDGRRIAPCCMGVFENRLGGRVCAAGYFAWTHLQNLAKSSEIKKVLRWLSRDTLSAYICSYHKINMWTRELSGGSYTISIVNASLDLAENVRLAARTERTDLCVTDMKCSDTAITCSCSEGPYREFILPTLQPWSIYLVTL